MSYIIGTNASCIVLHCGPLPGRWLDPLNELLGKVSDEFSGFFSQMGCAGEVHLSENEVGSPLPLSLWCHCSVVILLHSQHSAFVLGF